MIRRVTLTEAPPIGDYILSPTGFTWNLRRSQGNGTVRSISVGDREKKVALEKLLRSAESDRADAWETAGDGLFWLVQRFRPA